MRSGSRKLRFPRKRRKKRNKKRKQTPLNLKVNLKRWWHRKNSSK